MLLTQTYRESTVAQPSSTKPLSRQGTRSLPRRKLSHNIPTPFKRHLGCKRKSCFIFRSVESFFVSNTLVLFLNRGFATCHIISSSHRAKCKPFLSRVLIKYFSKLYFFKIKYILYHTPCN